MGQAPWATRGLGMFGELSRGCQTKRTRFPMAGFLPSFSAPCQHLLLEKLSPSLSGMVTPRLLSDSPLVHSHGICMCSFLVWVPVLFAARFQVPRTVSAHSQGPIQICRLEG